MGVRHECFIGLVVTVVLLLAASSDAQTREPWDSVRAETTARDLSQQLERVRDVMLSRSLSSEPGVAESASFTDRELGSLVAGLEQLAERLADGAGRDATREDLRGLQARLQVLVSMAAQSSGGGISPRALEALRPGWEALVAQYSE